MFVAGVQHYFNFQWCRVKIYIYSYILAWCKYLLRQKMEYETHSFIKCKPKLEILILGARGSNFHVTAKHTLHSYDQVIFILFTGLDIIEKLIKSGSL